MFPTDHGIAGEQGNRHGQFQPSQMGFGIRVVVFSLQQSDRHGKIPGFQVNAIVTQIQINPPFIPVRKVKTKIFVTYYSLRPTLLCRIEGQPEFRILQKISFNIETKAFHLTVIPVVQHHAAFFAGFEPVFIKKNR